MYRSRVQRRPSSMLTMPPSTIHHISSDTVDIISPELDKSIIEVSKNALKAGELLKIQAVQNEGLWFALNSAQLDLCRRLEEEGSCKVVLVDPVPATEVPRDVRRMMKIPVSRGNNRKTTAGNSEPEVDNSVVADTPGGKTGKGYHMLKQADPMEVNDRGQSTNRIEGHASTDPDEDEVTRARGVNDPDLDLGEKVEPSDDSSEEDSSDSECDWSEEAEETGSEDDHARRADTSDEMSCLL